MLITEHESCKFIDDDKQFLKLIYYLPKWDMIGIVCLVNYKDNLIDKIISKERRVVFADHIDTTTAEFLGEL